MRRPPVNRERLLVLTRKGRCCSVDCRGVGTRTLGWSAAASLSNRLPHDPQKLASPGMEEPQAPHSVSRSARLKSEMVTGSPWSADAEVATDDTGRYGEGEILCVVADYFHLGDANHVAVLVDYRAAAVA